LKDRPISFRLRATKIGLAATRPSTDPVPLLSPAIAMPHLVTSFANESVAFEIAGIAEMLTSALPDGAPFIQDNRIDGEANGQEPSLPGIAGGRLPITIFLVFTPCLLPFSQATPPTKAPSASGRSNQSRRSSPCPCPSMFPLGHARTTAGWTSRAGIRRATSGPPEVCTRQ
jgi:hypothetical protein